MAMEWFDRVSGQLQDHLESICDKYDQEGHMSIDRGAKHPRIDFFVETEDDDRDYFCTLHYDPNNEEFFVESYDIDLDQKSKTILEDIEDIVDAVHESFHDFLNEDDYSNVEVYLEDEHPSTQEVIEDLDIEWETPEVTAYTDQDGEVEVTYKFGIVNDTGDGILQRINRIQTADDELIKDEFNFIFSKEEAGTIISLIASHLDDMENLDYDY